MLRFEREAKAAARLHHTNIVPVFGVGRQDGHHYFVMQFITGLGLDVVLDDLRRLRQPKSGVSPVVECAAASSRSAGLTAGDVARSLFASRFAAAGPTGASCLTEPLDDADSAVSPTAANGPPPDAGSSPAMLPGSSELSASSDPDRQFYRSIARIGIQVAEALEYANRQGILHRDVKPSNLLLDNHGNVWVADFGLAKTAEADDLTHTGDILGTIRYMAPERFSGHCDARSDVYSLGLTLYELVALRPAYEASDRHTLMDRVLNEEPERLRKVAPGVPRDMETIIAKAAARDPAGRYATAAAIVDDLRRFVEDRPIRARRVSAVERVARWCRRNKTLAASISIAAIALVAVAAMSLVYARRQAHCGTEKTATNERIARLAGDLQASLSQSNGLATDLQASLAVSERRRVTLTYERARTNFERGQGACERGEIGPGLLYFIESWRSAIEAHDLGLAHAARANLSAWRHQAPRLLRQFPSTNVGRISRYSPDGKTVLTGSADQTARLWDAATGSPIGAPLMHQGPVYHALYSPDGKTVLTGSTDQTARLWDAATGTPIGAPSLNQGRAGAIAYGRDVKTVLTVTADGTPRVWAAAAGGSLLGRPLSHRANIQSVAFRPDGNAVVLGGTDGSARIWDTVTGSPSGARLSHHGAVNAVAFSPDGRIVLTGSSDRSARLWDAATGAALGTPLVHPGEVYAVAYSQDGKTVVTGSSNGSARIWDTATGNAIGVPLTFGAHVHSLAISPDSRIVAGAGDGPTARLWDAATGAAIGSLMRPRAFLLAMAFSPDGKTLLTAGSSGLDVWDAATDRLIGSIELSPEGRSWESPRSARLLSLARWDRAYARLMELRPDDGQLWYVRGRYHALRDRWELAAADFARGITSAPQDSEEGFEYASLRLIIGDDEGYRTFVQEIRRREGQTSSPFVAYVLARTGTLAAEPVVEPEQVIRWAEAPLRYGRPPWNLHVAGAAHYRAGHFAQAIKWLEESNAAFSADTSGDHFQLQNRFVLAMAQKRSGRAAQARAMLAEAQRLWQRIEAARIDAAVSLPTVDWLPMRILRREAEAVILYDPVFPSDPFAH